jgi:hypothetical protein
MLFLPGCEFPGTIFDPPGRDAFFRVYSEAAKRRGVSCDRDFCVSQHREARRVLGFEAKKGSFAGRVKSKVDKRMEGLPPAMQLERLVTTRSQAERSVRHSRHSSRKIQPKAAKPDPRTRMNAEEEAVCEARNRERRDDLCKAHARSQCACKVAGVPLGDKKRKKAVNEVAKDPAGAPGPGGAPDCKQDELIRHWEELVASATRRNFQEEEARAAGEAVARRQRYAVEGRKMWRQRCREASARSEAAVWRVAAARRDAESAAADERAAKVDSDCSEMLLGEAQRKEEILWDRLVFIGGKVEEARAAVGQDGESPEIAARLSDALMRLEKAMSAAAHARWDVEKKQRLAADCAAVLSVKNAARIVADKALAEAVSLLRLRHCEWKDLNAQKRCSSAYQTDKTLREASRGAQEQCEIAKKLARDAEQLVDEASRRADQARLDSIEPGRNAVPARGIGVCFARGCVVWCGCTEPRRRTWTRRG